MKRIISIIIMAACLSIAGCDDTPSDVPSAICRRISQYSTSIQRVDECLYHNNTVYFFCGSTMIVNSTDYLFSSNGTLMACFGGHSDGNCTDFFETARVVRVIWANGSYTGL